MSRSAPFAASTTATQGRVSAVNTTGRPRTQHPLLAHIEPDRANQSDHAYEEGRVEMGEEDVRERERHAVAHHLARRPLAALEQQGLPLAHESEGGDVSLHRRPSRGR